MCGAVVGGGEAGRRQCLRETGEWGSEPGGAGDQEEGRASVAEAGGSVVNRKRGLVVPVAQGKGGGGVGSGGQVSSPPPRGMPCGPSSAPRSEIDGVLG